MSDSLIITGSEVQARLLRRKCPGADVQTFHEWITGLLSQHGSHVGLRPDLYIASDIVDKRQLVDVASTRKERVTLGMLTKEDVLSETYPYMKEYR